MEDILVFGWKGNAAQCGASPVPLETEGSFILRVVLASDPSELCACQVEPG